MFIEQYSVVVLEDKLIRDFKYHGFFDDKDFMFDNYRFIFLGEIPNMGGHCVVAGYGSGKIYAGFHNENYRLPTEDEL